MRFDNPQHDALASFPIRFCVPVFFGEPPVERNGPSVSSGSGCIIRLGDRLFGITCQHVLTGYRTRRASGNPVFNFGPVALNPDEYVIAEDAAWDVATLELTSFIFPDTDLNGGQIIEPSQWPPAPVGRTDVLCFAGIPGVWRESIGSTHLRFYSFSSGATAADAIGDHHLVTRIYMEDTLQVLRDGLVAGSLGGMSGGPVFVWRDGPILHAEFVGIVKEYQEVYDLLYIRRATCIDANGALLPYQ